MLRVKVSEGYAAKYNSLLVMAYCQTIEKE